MKPSILLLDIRKKKPRELPAQPSPTSWWVVTFQLHFTICQPTPTNARSSPLHLKLSQKDDIYQIKISEPSFTMDLAGQLRSALAAQSLPSPSPSFLTTLTTSRTPPPPLPSLLATAKARILACDLSSSIPTLLDASLPCLPPSADDPRVEQVVLSKPVHVQLLDVENLAQSRWEQVEEIEAIERGEKTRGREVVRVASEDAAEAPATAGNATHRLVLQDSKGQRIYALEMTRISSKIGIGKSMIGEKMLLRAGTVIARGTVFLTSDKVVFLGGKVDAWHENWISTRLARLKEAAGIQ